MAGSAGHSDLAVNDICHLKADILLSLSQRLEILHEAQVVLHLGKCAHAGKHHHHIGKRCGKADRPAGNRHGRILSSEQLLSILRHLCQRPALDRLHDNDRFPVLYADLIAGAALYPFTFPVQVVDLQLDKLHLRVLREDPVQKLRLIMEGKARMLYEPLGLLIQQPGEAVKLLIGREHAGFNAVEQVVIKIPGTGLFQLCIENLVPVLKGLHKSCMKLGCQGK